MTYRIEWKHTDEATWHNPIDSGWRHSDVSLDYVRDQVLWLQKKYERTRNLLWRIVDENGKVYPADALEPANLANPCPDPNVV